MPGIERSVSEQNYISELCDSSLGDLVNGAIGDKNREIDQRLRVVRYNDPDLPPIAVGFMTVKESMEIGKQAMAGTLLRPENLPLNAGYISIEAFELLTSEGVFSPVNSTGSMYETKITGSDGKTEKHILRKMGIDHSARKYVIQIYDQDMRPTLTV